MTAKERREAILSHLKESKAPASATALAGLLGVSRQVIVGDMALLRAEGMDIISTPRGYYLKKEKKACLRILVCRHDREATGKELTAIVRAGGIIHDVRVEHEIYGELHGQLEIKSEEDAVSFVRAMQDSGSPLLSDISGGIHTHLVETKTEEEMAQVIHALREIGVLYE